MKKLRYWYKLLYNFLFTNKTKWLTIRVIVLSGYYRLITTMIPMKKLENRFGQRGMESPEEDSYEHVMAAYWIGNRVERVCKKTSWKSLCLVRALIAQKLLLEKGIHTTLYLGVRKETTGISAHAWLRCGKLYVTGGDGNSSGHATVACFYK